MEMILIAAAICLGGFLEVCLSTCRTVLIVNGRKKRAALLAFLQVFLWFFIVKTALKEDSLLVVFGYATGYALGAYTGTILSESIFRGHLNVQIITSNINLKELLREKGYALTSIEAKGQTDTKEILMVEINKNMYKELKELVDKLDPNAFMIATQTKVVENGFIKN